MVQRYTGAMRTLILLLASVACHHTAPLASPDPSSYDAAREHLSAASEDGELAWERLRYLSDDIGARLTGSPAEQRAVQWAAEELRKDGFDAVMLEPVMAPHWVRGHERVHDAESGRRLSVLALGNSAGTPNGPITAPVLIVKDWDELGARADEVPGHIVLFNAPFTTYAETAGYRFSGPAEAAKLGAVAAAVRSIAPVGYDTPHTGVTDFTGATPLPAFAITAEDADWMARRHADGHTVRLSVDLGAESLGQVQTHNVVAEVRGTTHPDEIVTLGCHLDSWDVGQGAQDDAAGCMVVWEAARHLAALGPAPRTLRLVLFANEENGLAGAREHGRLHADETHIAAIESDTGAGRAEGFRVSARRDDNEDEERVTRVLGNLSATGIGMRPGHAGSDLGPLLALGAMGLGVDHDTAGYWPIHHTRADTLERVDPQAVRNNVALTSTLAWWLLRVDRAALQ